MSEHSRAFVFADEYDAREDQRGTGHEDARGYHGNWPPCSIREGVSAYPAPVVLYFPSVVKRETIQRVATPTAILVGLSPPLATSCVDALSSEGGLRVLRVGHVAAACERIPVIMPRLVVVSSALRPEEVETVADRCIAVGAELLTIAPELERDAPLLTTTLRGAASAALRRSLRNSI